MNAVQRSHEYYRDLCAAVATNQSSPSEDEQLAEHIKSCRDCGDIFQSCETAASLLITDAVSQHSPIESKRTTVSDVLEMAQIKKHVLRACTRDVMATTIRPAEVGARRNSCTTSIFAFLPSWSKVALAASVLLLFAVGSRELWLANRHAKELEAKSQNLQILARKLNSQLESAQTARRETLAPPQLPETKEFEKLAAQAETWHRDLVASEAARNEELKRNAELEARTRLLQSSLEVLQSASTGLQTDRNQLAAKTVDQATALAEAQRRIADLTQEALSRDRSVERQQKLLATDHDIRDILGARSLHIIDVLDVDAEGETRRPFGRIFYTEGRSLIFYAFDLDLQKGLKRGVSFQAWGQKITGKEEPRMLGAFYMDEPSQNRWILRVDDGKTLARIDYVFVTDSSRKDNLKPKGKPILSAFLNVAPNHP